jgi:serine/threonine protein kinase
MANSSATIVLVSIVFGLICIIFYNINIKKLLNVSTLSDNLNYSSISKGSGAEDLNLMQLQKSSPLSCNIVLNTMGISPHLPMSLRYLYGDSIDKFMFGEDEAISKSPWNIFLYILSPGYLASQYIKVFFDTNYYLSLILYISWLFSDLEFWLELTTFFSGNYIIAVQSYLLRLVSASTVAFLLYLSHSYVQGLGTFGLEDAGGIVVCIIVIVVLRSFGAWSIYKGTDNLGNMKYDTMTLPTCIGIFVGICFHLFSSYMSDTICNVSLFATPLYSLYKIKTYIDGFIIMHKDAALKREIVDPEKAAIVTKFLRTASLDTLWNNEDFNKLYTVGTTTLGKGGFGTVTLGTKIATNEQVAIKYLHVNLDHDIPALCAGLVKCALEGKKNISDKISEALFQDLLAAAKLDYNSKVKFLLHELKALQAIKLLNSDGLLKLHSAHVLDGPIDNPRKSYMVLSIIEPLGKEVDKLQPQFVQDMNTSTKLSVIQTFFSALAELHSVGIVHRDIKPENVAVSRTNMKQAVIFDLGICLLPNTDDITKDCSSGLILSPDEMKRTHNNDKSSQVFDRLVKKAIRNESGDCWSAALVAIHVITGGIAAHKILNPSIYDLNKSFEMWLTAVLSWDTKLLDDFLIKLHLYLPKDMPGNVNTFLGIIRSLMTPRNSDRMSMKTAMSHAYFINNKIGIFSNEFRVAEVYNATKYDAIKRDIRENAARERSNKNSLALLRNLLKQGSSLSTAVMSDTRKLRSTQTENYINKLLDLCAKKEKFTLNEFTNFLSESRLAEVIPFDAETLYKLFDHDNTNSVERHELLAALLILITPLATESTRLKLVFRAFDGDNNSKLDRTEFRLLLEKYVLPLRQYEVGADIDGLFTVIDKRNNGAIDFDEFIAGIHSNQMLHDAILG